MHSKGATTKEKYKQAIIWAEKAANQEYIEAYSRLFSNYLAQQYSHIEAQQLSDELAKEMTATDLALAKEWGEQWLHDAKYRTLGVAVEPLFDW